MFSVGQLHGDVNGQCFFLWKRRWRCIQRPFQSTHMKRYRPYQRTPEADRWRICEVRFVRSPSIKPALAGIGRCCANPLLGKSSYSCVTLVTLISSVSWKPDGLSCLHSGLVLGINFSFKLCSLPAETRLGLRRMRCVWWIQPTGLQHWTYLHCQIWPSYLKLFPDTVDAFTLTEAIYRLNSHPNVPSRILQIMGVPFSCKCD